MMVMGDASDIIEYDRSRSEMSNAALGMKEKINSMEQ